MKKIINGLSVFLSGSNESKSIVFVHGFPFDHTNVASAGGGAE